MFGNQQETSGTHPGELGPLGRLWEMAKHVFSKAAKYGAAGMGIGALIGAPLAIVGMIPGFLSTAGAAIAGVLGFGGAATSFGLGAIASIAVPLLVPALAVGAALAVVGAVAGMASANEKANEVSEDRMANYDRAVALQQRNQAMQMRQAQMQMAMMQQAQQAQAPGLSGPNLGLPGGRGGNGLSA